ncbi:MAG TPA: cupin domain-containing protein [Solirubrobacterales bacterium]|nr:cupin domain-containing protein [Solirubrobacterales bacterium]
MKRFNVLTGDLQRDDDPDGYHADYAKLGPAIGGRMLAGAVYELPPGQSNCPYHYEHGDEEWLIVLAGRPTVRHPEGEDELAPGDVVCFPAGPDGAHKTINRSEEAARVVIVSTRRMPAVAVYPDSDKIGVFTEDRSDDLMVRRESGIDYWDGER